MDWAMDFFKGINEYLWGSFLLFALCGTGAYFTLGLRFVQVRKFGAAFRQVFGKKAKGETGGISSFQALTTAVAAQVGTGNLAGAATAIVGGGPGAIFWMWVSAFLGMATTYAEALMAQKFRTRVDGQITGGPVYYIRGAFPGPVGKVLAGAFAFFIILALGVMGSMVQANSIGQAFSAAFGVRPALVGGLVAFLALLTFAGGIKRIAAMMSFFVPIMAGFYLAGALWVICGNWQNILPALESIFVGAFAPQAVVGGVAGATVKQAIRLGVARGLFSNESGMGSTPHAHGAAQVAHPVQQGYVAMLGTFIDTFVILTMTALVILTSGALGTGLDGTALTQAGFTSVFGKGGGSFIAICMLFFAFSSIVGWYYFGEINVRYLFGKKAIRAYGLLVCICIVVGSALKVELVWEMADTCNALMVLPNLLALLALGGPVAKLTADYENRRK